MADLTKLTPAMLNKQHEMIFAKIMELSLEDKVANGAKIAQLNIDLEKVAEELHQRGPQSSPEIKVEGRTTSRSTELGKDMRNSLDRIPELTPGADTSVFLAALENCYKNYVEAHPDLEERYVKYSVTRLCSAYQTQVHNVTPRISKWADLKTYISDNYGLKLTPFQKLDSLFELKADADWAGYCAKLQNHADEVL